jgi:hypothetical protein
MKSIEGIRQSVGCLIPVILAAFAMSGSANATSANTDVTDIWWNSNKSGNGYQLVNTGTFVFVTGYVYGLDRQPFWISGELQKVEAALATFTGPLYVTSGPYFGDAYDPSTVTFRQAGTMTFALTDGDTGQLSYSVDGVFVSEPLQRQPLTLDDYNGSYMGYFTATRTNCGARNGVFTSPIGISISQSGQSMTQVWTFPLDGNVCTNTGTYSQLGRMGQFVADYTCTSGEFGTKTMYEMSNVPYMFTARFVDPGTGNGCTSNGEVSGVIPR